MSKKKTSPIWFMETEKLAEIVKRSDSITGILKSFELYNKGNNYKTLYLRLKLDGIDFSHIKRGNKGKKFPNAKKIPLEEILTENSTYNRSHLKQRLLKNGMLKNECYECKLGTEWNGKKISLQIDHINGVSNDNRLENLRIICPNCHSQTQNFAGKNFKRTRKIRPRIHKDNSWRKDPRPKIRKVVRPNKEELQKLLWEKPTTKLAQEFGVSDRAIGKWAKSYGISKPPRGYWVRVNNE